ncbi:MAG: winged helix-turn-helix domain-containing protein [Methanosarcinales archaeon]
MEDKTLFLKFFGTETPILKVIDYLIDNEAFDHSKSDIAKGAGISRATLFNLWKILEENNIVIKTRTIGRAKMFKLNTKNSIVKKLMDLDDAISDYYAEKACIEEEIMLKTPL